MDRRGVLEQALKPTPGFQIGSYVEAEGKALFQLAQEKGMEGITAKRKDSLYRPGKRTSDWLKIKARLQQQFVDVLNGLATNPRALPIWNDLVG
jgi:bifunctional non-homologous end joining protein LigD